MKSKSVRYSSVVIAVSLLLALAATTVVACATRWSPPPQSPPPPPTPGPPPTSAPYKPEGGEPVRNREEAIQHVLLIDSDWAAREQPLTKEMLAANPDMIIVEQYATRQEAADRYFGDGFGDPAIASEPVWVVRIKGKACLMTVGGGYGFEEAGCVESDGVTYVISQKTGYLLGMSTSAQTRSERLSQDTSLP